MRKRFLLVIFFCLLSSVNFACSLGKHEWEIAFSANIPLSGPLLPAHEFSLLANRFVPDELQSILWVNDSNFSTAMIASLKALLPYWPGKLSFKAIHKNDLRKSDIASTTIIVEPSVYQIRVVLFVDRLSQNRCKQLVIMQEGWLRMAMPKAKLPVAAQYKARSWLSVFFFDAPVPGQIMSINAFPSHGFLKEYFVDETFVGKLIDNNLIQARPADYVTPYPDGFPTGE